MALRDLGIVWRLARRIEDLFERVDNATRSIQALRESFGEIEKRVAALEAREDLVIEKTKAAAAVAASNAVTHHLIDMSRRIGALEAGQGAQRRLE